LHISIKTKKMKIKIFFCILFAFSVFSCSYKKILNQNLEKSNIEHYDINKDGIIDEKEISFSKQKSENRHKEPLLAFGQILLVVLIFFVIPLIIQIISKNKNSIKEKD